MLISSLPVRRLGIPGDHARLRFSSTNSAARHLLVEGEPAFELSFWCGTCPFLFRRKVGADKTFSADVGSLEGLQRQDDVVDERVIDTFARLLPEGDYLPLLLDVQPELVAPHDDRDYFTREQPATGAPPGPGRDDERLLDVPSPSSLGGPHHVRPAAPVPRMWQ